MATATLAGGFTYGELQALALTPTSGPAIGGTACTVTGVGFDSILTAATLGDVPVDNLVVVSDTELTFDSPAHPAGVVDLVVFQGAEDDTIPFAFNYTITLPSVTSITPDTGSEAGGTEITIVGSNFDASSTVFIGGNPCTDVVVSGPTEITCITPPGSVGAEDVVITSSQGDITITDGFVYYTSALTLTGTSVIASLTTGGDDISISGLNFDGSTVIEIGGVAITDSTFVSDVLITGKIPTGTAGVADVVAIKGVETYELTDYFTYIAPLTITSITPNNGLPSGGQAIAVVGSGIDPSATVTIGGIPIEDFTFVSSNTVTGITPPNSTGTKDVVIFQNTPVGTLSDLIDGGFIYSIDGYLGIDRIKDTFDQLLYVAGGVDDELKQVQDAAGNFTPINVSTDTIEIVSTTLISGKLII